MNGDLFNALPSAMDLRRSPPARRRWPWVAGAVVILVIGVGLLIVFERSSIPKGLEFSVARRGNISLSALGVGEFVSFSKYELTAPEAGTVVRMSHRVGDKVGAGTVLIELASPALKVEAEEASIELRKAQLNGESDAQNALGVSADAEAAVETAKLRAKLAHSELEAYQKLTNKGLVSKLQFGKVQGAATEADLAVEIGTRKLHQARQMLARQRTMVKDMVELSRSKATQLASRMQSLAVVAPNSGVIKALHVHLGAAVTAGEALGEIGPSTSDGALLRFPADYLDALKSGVPVKLSFNGINTQGHVQRVEPDLKNGYLMVEVGAVALPPSARVGLTVRGEASLGSIDDVVYVPSEFVPPVDGSPLRVWRLRDGKLKQLQLRDVRAALGKLIFPSQIRPGDKVAITDSP